MTSNRRLNHVFEWISLSDLIPHIGVVAEYSRIQCRYCHLKTTLRDYRKFQKERCTEREQVEAEMEILSAGY